jgi:hypothetical protein
LLPLRPFISGKTRGTAALYRRPPSNDFSTGGAVSLWRELGVAQTVWSLCLGFLLANERSRTVTLSATGGVVERRLERFATPEDQGMVVVG